MVCPVIGDPPDGFCKLIVERDRRYSLGGHVVGEYSAEVIQTASACMAANLRIEQIAELQPAFPTFTEGITIAAQTIVRQMGLAPTAPSWGELRAGDATPGTSTACDHSEEAGFSCSAVLPSSGRYESTLAPCVSKYKIKYIN